MNFTRKQILAVTRSKDYRCSEQSNYPSFITFYGGTSLKIIERKFERIVTNVGNGAAKYSVTVNAPEGSRVTVTPERLVFGKKGERKGSTLTITSDEGHKRGYHNRKRVAFGDVVWVEENGSHIVRSPIVVSPSLPF
ncbi:hypothetical protein TIFTF001_001128 [Ficus carica]|uniref:Subtilisin-like protease fibronectin type-III domain-containing protein n=1 Tax=Ficus carica TaxID=3494 RepID=A0AA87ZGK4_FICCA|nr:hypothetical protein TIFTF001_001128 [Ficus carica]